MSATMARQGRRVQLEQSDIRLALNMAKMGKGGFSHTTIEETQFLPKNPQAEVREEMKHVVEFPGHQNVNPAMEWHTAMLREYHTDGCLPCHNGIAQNPQTGWRCNGTGAPPREWLRLPTPDLIPHPPDTLLDPPSNNVVADLSEIEGVPPGYVYIHTPLPSA